MCSHSPHYLIFHLSGSDLLHSAQQRLFVLVTLFDCQNLEALIWVSSSAQAASVQQYCNGLKVNVVLRGFSVFRPDRDISIVYRPLCACLSPNRDSGCFQNTKSHREGVYHILKKLGLCVCMWSMHMLCMCFEALM